MPINPYTGRMTGVGHIDNSGAFVASGPAAPTTPSAPPPAGGVPPPRLGTDLDSTTDNFRNPMQRANRARPELLNLILANGRSLGGEEWEEVTDQNDSRWENAVPSYSSGNQRRYAFRPGTFGASVADKYKGAFGTINSYVNDNTEAERATTNWDKLPKTRFGSAENAYSLEEGLGKGQHLIDPRAVYDDPVYGRITHRSNIYEPQRGLNKYMPQVVKAVMSHFAPMATAGMNAAVARSNGQPINWMGIGASALGAGIGASGIGASMPAWAQQAAQMARYGQQAYGGYNAIRNLNRRPPRRP